MNPAPMSAGLVSFSGDSGLPMLAIVAALDHMERDAGRKEAGLAGHATSITAAALASPSAK